MITLHTTEVIVYFLKQHSIYKENCSTSFYLIWEKFVAAEGTYPFFRKTKNLFELFMVDGTSTITMYKSAGNCSGKCEKIMSKLGSLIFTLKFMMQSYMHNFCHVAPTI